MLDASTLGTTCAVLTVAVTAVVGKVMGVVFSIAEKALSVKKTRAKPGAGTVTEQIPLLHCTVSTVSAPVSRPSDSKLFPKVWNKHELSVQGRQNVNPYLTGPRIIPLLGDGGSA